MNSHQHKRAVEERLLYFTTIELLQPGGPNVNEYEFVKRLANEYGNRLTCVVSSRSAKADFLQGIDCVPVASSPFRLRPAWVLDAVRTAILLWRVARSRRSSLLVARADECPLALWMVASLGRLPVALKSVGVYWNLAGTDFDWKSRLVWRFKEAIMDDLIRRAKVVDSVTPELVSMIRARTRRWQGLAHIDNTTDVPTFAAVHMSDGKCDVGKEFVLGYVGSFPSKRGAAQLVELVAKLQERIPGLRAIVAGDDDELEILRQRAVALGVDGRVRFCGFMPYESIPEIIGQIDLGISLDDIGRALLIGNSSQKVRQYLAAGRPVITIRQGNGFVDEFDLGTTVDPQDMEGMVRAVSGWYERLQRDETRIRERIMEYAAQNLDHRVSLGRRLQLWGMSDGTGS